MINHRFLFAISFGLMVFIIACSDNDSNSEPQITTYDSSYISSTRVLTRSASDIRSFINIGNIDIDQDKMIYNVSINRMVYETTHKGQTIEASSLVILPIAEDTLEVGLLSFQHGTIFSDEEAPTNVSISDAFAVLYAAAATPGLIVVVPDYIGYGESNEFVHPYLIAEPTATAVIDNIRAGRELAELSGIKFNGALFLAGYSQGGYATMATHKAIEEMDSFEDYQLVSSYPAAGGYGAGGSTSISMEAIFTPHFHSYQIYSYIEYYGLSLGLGDFINEPYAGQLPSLFDGSFSSTQIVPLLNDTASIYFTSEYLAADPKFSEFSDRELENGLIDWTPKARILMFHSNQDEVVAAETSQLTYDAFISSGATDVELVTVDGGTHIEGVIPYVELIFNDVINRL